jgi:topoisomerase-4 subunit B
MIEAGMVYVVLSPLFKADFKGKTVLGDTLADCMKQLPKNCQPIVTRLKGHGEVDAKWLKQYAMDPNTRKLLQVSFGEDDEAVVLKVMGDDAGFRKVILGIETAEDDVTDGIQA